MAQFRYIVNDVDSAVEFYTANFAFTLLEQYGPAMAIMVLGDLQLWVAGPMSSAAKPMTDGSQPGPGGWSRLVLTVENLPEKILQLQNNGVTFRNKLVDGPGGKQILCEDPSGNIIELFQSTI